MAIWVLAFAVGIGIMYGLDAYEVRKTGVEPSAFVRCLYGVFHRLGWGMCVCWVIFACTKGYGGWINRFLSWELFSPLAKLTYCMYLLHFTVIGFVYSFLSFQIVMNHLLTVSYSKSNLTSAMKTL